MTTNNARGMAEKKLLSFKVRHYCYLNTPSGPHVVVASDGLAVAHEAEAHGRADKVADEGEVHATHGEKGALGDGHDGVDIPLVSLPGLYQLCGRVVVRNVEPQPMRHGGRHVLTEAELGW
jgi:hypothetical protein